MTASIQQLTPPPQNIEIEESILAGCMLSPELRDDALLYLDASDFYKILNQKIFTAISKLTDANKPTDVITVADHLRNQDVAASEVARIMDTPLPSSVQVYADRLKRYAQLREVMQLCGHTIAACTQSNIDDLEEVLSEFQSKSLRVGQSIQTTWVEKDALGRESLQRYEELRKGSNAQSLPTGFPTLDKITGGGFRGPKLVIVAARPRVGKTALMCNMAANMAKRGIVCGIFELEMPREEIDDRWIAAGAKINSMKLSSEPGPNDSEWQQIKRVVEDQAGWPIMVDDKPATIGELKRRAKQMVKEGARIIFIDQLSSIGGNRRRDIFTRNTEHVEELKFLKKELGIPVVLLAQLNRELEKRTSKKPILSDLKNTGQLEEDADIILMGHRPYLYSKDDGGRDESLRGYAEWEITKNRQGAEWNIRMNWAEEYQLFTERII